MLRWAIAFFVIALIAAIFGFSGVAGVATNIAWILAVIFLVLFILGALAGNASVFIHHIWLVALAVFIHDTLALLLGYGIAAGFKVSEPNRRAITFEVGVRNAALGLGIALSVFEGLGGVAIVAAWWGVWDLVAGLILSTWWGKKPTGDPSESTLEAAEGV